VADGTVLPVEPQAPAPVVSAAATLADRLLPQLTKVAYAEWSLVDVAALAESAKTSVTPEDVEAAMSVLAARGTIELRAVQPPHLFRYRLA
ncbi:MAG TPA: hypothetical protein VEA78_05995, partial [Acidimicrobiales bacterium]|nr:hypothetical protein [Acidimicrobiales bacterium]